MNVPFHSRSSSLRTGPVLGLDNRCATVLILDCCPKSVPSMANRNTSNNVNDVLIKFVAPRNLKRALQELANERNITLSALLRLISSGYAKRNNSE